MREKISITIEQGILHDIDGVIDNVYIKNRSQAIEHLVRSSLGENRATVILMGGPEEGLRLREGLYSPLSIIHGKPLVEHAIRKLRDSGFKTIYIVARHVLLTKVFEAIKNGTEFGVSVVYVEEKRSSGTFNSLQLVKGKLAAPFLVVYGDILFEKVNIEQLWNDHVRQHPVATILLTTSPTPKEKGTVKVEGNKVLEFTQKPRKSDIYLVFSPIFVAEPHLLEYEGASLEFDIFPQLAEKGLLNGHLSSEKERHIHSLEDLKL
jgi:NDP-sugar pyrophosphorylase family protein